MLNRVKLRRRECWDQSCTLGIAVQQSGAVEACWAHNPEVRRSKLRSANPSFFVAAVGRGLVPDLDLVTERRCIAKYHQNAIGKKTSERWHSVGRYIFLFRHIISNISAAIL